MVKRLDLEVLLDEAGPFSLKPEELADEKLILFSFEKKGFIAAFYYPEIHEALILSLFVHPLEREKGVGAHLMQKLIDHLRSLEAKIIQLRYKSTLPQKTAFEKILEKTGFSKPLPILRRYDFDPKTFNPGWYLSSKPILPNEYTVFPWKNLTAQEKEQISRWILENPQMEQYNPLIASPPIESLNSLGLRHQGSLIGWMVTRRPHEKLIEYSDFFVFPEARGLGPAIYLLKKSIQSHISSESNATASMQINLKTSSKSWIRFVEKRLARASQRIEDTYSTYIYLI